MMNTGASAICVVSTGSWLSSRKVLISPIALGHAGWMARQLPVALTRARVERSPDIDTKQSVSRQHEAEYSRYYGYLPYWAAAGRGGMGVFPGSVSNRQQGRRGIHGTGAGRDIGIE